MAFHIRSVADDVPEPKLPAGDPANPGPKALYESIAFAEYARSLALVRDI